VRLRLGLRLSGVGGTAGPTGLDYTPAFYNTPSGDPAYVATFAQTESRTYQKVGGIGDWLDAVTSVEAITGPQRFSAIVPAAAQIIFGVTSATNPVPPTSGDWSQTEVGFYVTDNAAFDVFNNALPFTYQGARAEMTVWSADYNAAGVWTLYRNGVATGTTYSVGAGLSYRLFASFNTVGSELRDFKHLAL
jgi:hypothetical protein